jgi:ArsR family transcriptional regulator
VQPTLSQHLAVLRDQQVVSTRPDGKHIYYSLSSPQALALMKTLHAQFCPGPLTPPHPPPGQADTHTPP